VAARPLVAAATVAALVGPLTACAARVQVGAAPSAGDPVCASVVLALPDALGALPRLRTTSQASVAWGDRAHPVVLRCGVEPPGPTTDQCETADDGRGTAVDWVAVPGEAREDGSADWTFTTYGRSPAVEVRVPAEVTSTRSTSFLLELGPAIAQVPAERHCL
jgi:hypothetical protein